MSEYETSDLALAAFLLMRGLQLVTAERLVSGRFRFLFSDPEASASNLAIEFINSDFVKFDNHIRNLKKLIHKR